MNKLLTFCVAMLLSIGGAMAQRYTDQLDRGLIAMKASGGIFVSWRIQADEYYDVKYNLYRNGSRIAENLSTSNYTDKSGTTSNTYTVKAVVNGVEQAESKTVNVWGQNYLDINIKHDSRIKSTLVPNDACCADVDGDGEVEILLKLDNKQEIENGHQIAGWYNEYSVFEVIKLDGRVLWWADCGPNMGDFQNNEQNIVGYDWDQDGKAEVLMRLEEGSVIHMADGTTYTIGTDGKNGTSWNNYRTPDYIPKGGGKYALAFNLPTSATASSNQSFAKTSIENGILYVTFEESTTASKGFRDAKITLNNGSTTTFTLSQPHANQAVVSWFAHYGNEFLAYCDGATGKPYQMIDFPCKRLESVETNLKSAWGDDYGHRSSKFFFGAPYLDGRKPSIFIGRGIYTRHKFVALDVNPKTHELTERWRWMNNTQGPWYGQGYHNYAIVDVDLDGRDEIVFGSMVIDDNGKGLSTTGLGHGDAQHHGDLNPFRHGQEGWFANEDKPGNNLRDLTTSEILYRQEAENDDGRAIMGNFSNDIPGATGSSARDNVEPVSAVTGKHVSGFNTTGMAQNFRCYWDGDLLDETFNSSNGKNTEGAIYKYGNTSPQEVLTGSMTNNDTKTTPCYMGDILGDWREEFIMRTADNHIRIYSTTIPTQWRNYSLWYDHQYRNGMVWQMCGYNQPPHVSYFLGELEDITAAPPSLTMTGRTEVRNNGTISGKDASLIACENGDMTINVAEEASPKLFVDNAPSWVQGSAPSEASATSYPITYTYYTHKLTGGAFTGNTRVVKQGDGTLIMPDVKQTYTGNTDVWNGTMQFNGTMEKSPLWMNRHTTLYSTGVFKRSVTMEYGSTLNINSNSNSKTAEYATVTMDTLELHEGARVVFNIDQKNNHSDALNMKRLILRKQNWENGPEYLAPILQINSTEKLAEGVYPIGSINSIEGELSDIILEFSNTTNAFKKKLVVEDNTLYLKVYPTTIGNTDYSSTWWTAFSDSYTLYKGWKYNFKFTNYGGTENNWFNWLLVIANGNGHSTTDRTDYSEYFVLRADKYGWGTYYQAPVLKRNGSETDNFATFLKDMAEGADVDMNVTFTGTTIEVYADIQSTTGVTYQYSFNSKPITEASTVTAFFTVEKSYITIPEVTSTPVDQPKIKMTYVDGSDDKVTTANGEVTKAIAGYNKISGGQVALVNKGWNANYITYMQVDASMHKGATDSKVTSMKLSFDVSGSTDNKRNTTWGIGYNNSKWSSDLTFSSANKNITTIGSTQTNHDKSSTVFETMSWDITDIFNNDDDGIMTIIVYETAAAGGYIQNPKLEVTREDIITTYQLTDGAEYNVVSNATYPNIEFTKNFTAADKWNALVVPITFNVEDYADKFDIAQVDKLKPVADTNNDRQVNDYDEAVLQIQKMTKGKITPHVPYLIRPKTTGEIKIKSADGILHAPTNLTTAYDGFSIVSIYSPVVATPENGYYYITTNGKLSHRTEGYTTIRPNRWYIKLDGVATAKEAFSIFVIGEDNATGVSEIDANASDDNDVYSVNGIKMKADSLPHGIYYHKGRKIIK